MAGQAPTYPFVPKSNAKLVPGQFWAIPLSDGRFACGRVLRTDDSRSHGKRTNFVAGLMDWVADTPPGAGSLAGSQVLEVGHTHVRTVAGGILGHRPLELDGITVPETITTYWGAGYPAERAERRFVHGDPPRTWGRREVASPLTKDMLRPMREPMGVVQFNSLLTDRDFIRLAEWLRDYPDHTLRAYGSYDSSITNLEFLRFFPSLRRFAADYLWRSLQSIDGLRHLPEDLVALGLGSTKRRHDLGILERFRSLTSLYLEGQTKGIEILSGMTSLEELTLRSITLPDLSILLPLSGLLSLDIKLGGTSNLGLLPEIGTLRYLELWMIKGLTDVSSIGGLSDLRYLFLQALRRVESLPDLSANVALRRVHLETLKGLTDLRPMAKAPALEQLVLVDMPHLQVDNLECLVGLPSLKAVSLGLGSIRKNEAGRALLGLPDATGFKVSWREM